MKFSSHIKMARQQGFTLLELLVVVAVLAIIGGATIASLGGFEKKASQGTATHTISAVEQGMRIYAVSEARLPADLEALACAPWAVNGATGFTALTVVNDAASSAGDADAAVGEAYKFGGESNVPGIGGGMGKKVADKFVLRAATAKEATALVEAGITSVRYAVTAACDNSDTTVESVTAYGVTDANFGDELLSAADIPNQAFEEARPSGSSLKNRSRGFSADMAVGAPIMVWNRGTLGYNNVKVGGGATDILIGLGVGSASDLVGNGVRSPFAKAPFYGQIGKDKYAHYIALVAIPTDAAAAVATDITIDDTIASEAGSAYIAAIVDARGDFLDEEVAEFTGQKS